MRRRYQYRFVYLGGPSNGAIIDTDRTPELMEEMAHPIDWCVCDDGTVVETRVECSTYLLYSIKGNDFKRTAIYVCEGWKPCACGNYIPLQQTSCAKCRREERRRQSYMQSA